MSLDVRRVTVPLSDEEARILREIEQQLYESDPDLARHVSTTTVYSEPVNRLRIASVAQEPPRALQARRPGRGERGDPICCREGQVRGLGGGRDLVVAKASGMKR